MKYVLTQEEIKRLEVATVIKSHHKQEDYKKFYFYKNEKCYYLAYRIEPNLDHIFFYEVYCLMNDLNYYRFDYTVKSFENHFQTKKQARKAKLLKLKNSNDD